MTLIIVRKTKKFVVELKKMCQERHTIFLFYMEMKSKPGYIKVPKMLVFWIYTIVEPNEFNQYKLNQNQIRCHRSQKF